MTPWSCLIQSPSAPQLWPQTAPRLETATLTHSQCPPQVSIMIMLSQGVEHCCQVTALLQLSVATTQVSTCGCQPLTSAA